MANILYPPNYDTKAVFVILAPTESADFIGEPVDVNMQMFMQKYYLNKYPVCSVLSRYIQFPKKQEIADGIKELGLILEPLEPKVVFACGKTIYKTLIKSNIVQTYQVVELPSLYYMYNMSSKSLEKHLAVIRDHLL